MKDVKQKVFSGVLWRFGEKFGAQIVSFIVSVVLARLLEPSYYGQISLVLIIANLLQVLIDSGFGNALIQKKNVDDVDFSTVFYFNVVVSIVLYFLLYLSAPYIAAFYGISTLTPIIQVLGGIMLISGVKNVQQAYVARHMLFKKFFFATIGGTVVSAVVAILMAYNGFGIWSLVAQQIINPIIDTIILWYVVPWRPVKAFSGHRLKKLFKFSWKLLIVSFLNSMFEDVRGIIIGKFYTTEDLAYYDNGQKIPKLLSQNLDVSIRNVIFPALSQEQDDINLVRTHMLRTIKTCSYIMFPVLFGLIACADRIILLVWTEKWIEAAPFLRITCIVLALNSIQATNQQTIIAMGRSDICLKNEIVIKTFTLLCTIISVRFGVVAVALSTLWGTIFALFFNLWPNRKLLACSLKEQFQNSFTEFIIALVMSVLVFIIGKILPFGNFIVLTIQISVGILIYLLLSYLFKIESFQFLVRIFMNLKKSYFVKKADKKMWKI